MRGEDDDGGAFDDEGNRHQRRACDGYLKMVVPFAGTALIAIVGWAVSLEVRIGNITAIQIERASVLGKLQAQIGHIEAIASDPSPKPQAKIELTALHKEHDDLDARVDRMETRLNYIHNYLIALPVRPPPIPMIPAPNKRGDLRLEDFIRGATPDRAVN